MSELGLVENDGIFRCVGRLVNFDLEVDVCRLIIFLRDYVYMILVIWDCYERVLYSGVRVMFVEMCLRYWVLKGR